MLGDGLLVPVLRHLIDAEPGQHPHVGGRPGLGHCHQGDLVGPAGVRPRNADAVPNGIEVDRQLLAAPGHAAAASTTAPP